MRRLPEVAGGEDGLIKLRTNLFFRMNYVYILKSHRFPEQIYIGYTKNLEERLLCHNTGGSIHTAKYKPWRLMIYLAFENETKAIATEKYLKTQSGRAFVKKRLL